MKSCCSATRPRLLEPGLFSAFRTMERSLCTTVVRRNKGRGRCPRQMLPILRQANRDAQVRRPIGTRPSRPPVIQQSIRSAIRSRRHTATHRRRRAETLPTPCRAIPDSSRAMSPSAPRSLEWLCHGAAINIDVTGAIWRRTLCRPRSRTVDPWLEGDLRAGPNPISACDGRRLSATGTTSCSRTRRCKGRGCRASGFIRRFANDVAERIPGGP